MDNAKLMELLDSEQGLDFMQQVFDELLKPGEYKFLEDEDEATHTLLNSLHSALHFLNGHRCSPAATFATFFFMILSKMEEEGFKVVMIDPIPNVSDTEH